MEKLEKYGVKGSAETKDYSALLDQLQTGDKLRFRLVLNPVKSLSSGKESGKRGRVIPLVTADQQLEYLKRGQSSTVSRSMMKIMLTGRSLNF